MLIQENNGTQCLILRRGSDAFFCSQMRQKGADLPFTHLARVPLPMEQNVLANPMHVRLFRAPAIMLRPDGSAHLVQKPGLASRVG